MKKFLAPLLAIAVGAQAQDHSMHAPDAAHADHAAPADHAAHANHAAHNHSPDATGPADCAPTQAWDYTRGMCQMLPSATPAQMLMVHGNVFAVQTVQSGRRAQNDFAAPNMVMVDWGRTIGARHYLNVDLMGTFERWTFATRGYPLFAQVGESDADGRPYVDAQHPHSSPIMGLTVSDTIALANNNFLKLSFAPRGQSTDGPIAFMHRPTSRYNPDAPLGHHIAQDVGHITSTVLAAEFKWNKTRVEFSAFNGEEPSPTEVDLPLGKPDSFAARLTHEFTPHWQAMFSYARAQHHDHTPTLGTPAAATGATSLDRYSASLYHQWKLRGAWKLNTAFILGVINHYDRTASLASIGKEWLLQGERPRIWARWETLQRTARQLDLSALSPDATKWVGALTVGYAHKLATIGAGDALELSAGASATRTWLPDSFRAAYSENPWTGRVYLQLGGMRMWDLL